MADLYSVAIQALVRESATVLPHWSTSDWETLVGAPTKSFRTELVMGPGTLTLPLSGFTLVQHLILHTNSPGNAYTFTYKDNAGATHAMLVDASFPVMVSSVSPSLSLSFLPFLAASFKIKIAAIGI